MARPSRSGDSISLSFDQLIARADELVLEDLVGSDTLRLLRALDSDLARPSVLRRVVLKTWSPAELLLSKVHRRLLMELLPEEKALELVHLLGGRPIDPFGYLTSLNLSRGSDRESTFLAFFSVTVPPIDDEDLSPDCLLIRPSYGLFDHQRRASDRVYELLHSGHRRVLLHMPTGAGKTRTAMTVIARHLRENESAVVVWLAHSEELCEQAATEFERAWEALGNRPLPIGRFWGHHSRDATEIDSGIVVAGFSKMYAALQSSMGFMGDLASRTSLVVIDEAHQAVAETYSLILDVLTRTGRESGLLGLTATPGRTWADIAQDAELAKFFSRQKVGLDTDANNAVEFLIDEGYLARPAFRQLFHDGAVSVSASDLDVIESGLEIPGSILKQLAADDQRNLKIILELQRLTIEHDRVIVFAATAQHATTLAGVLSVRGIEAFSVIGTTPSIRRARAIEAFRSDSSGPIVLCNYGVLTAGFDAPRTSAAVIARPTTSLVLYFQMVGRAMRGPAAGGNREAEIVTVVDTSLPGFGDMGEAFLNWEDVWEGR